MANERMVPILPCASIDVMRNFYLPLGFEVTYRQIKPNPYIAFRREGLELHYFGMDGSKAADSYGSCLVLVEDTEPLFDAIDAVELSQVQRESMVSTLEQAADLRDSLDVG